MIKVVHIISKLDIGGAEQVAFNISKSGTGGVSYHIVEVARADSSFTETLIKEAAQYGITIHRASVTNVKLAILAFPLRLRKILKEVEPNIIHTHTEVPDLSLFVSAKTKICNLQHVHLVRTIHNNQLWNGWKFIGGIVEKYLKHYATNIAISSATRDAYNEKYGQMSRIISNGVGQPTQLDYKGVVKGKINILFAARLEYQKGTDVLIDIINHYANDPRFYFHVVGIGTESSKIQTQLGAFNNVCMQDRIDSLPKYIGSFDYLLMPSLFEGLALTPIEAAFAGTPSIINAVPGLVEIFPNDWPLKVRDNSLEEYIAIFETIPTIDYRNLQLDANAYVSKLYCIENMQHNYQILYHEI